MVVAADGGVYVVVGLAFVVVYLLFAIPVRPVLMLKFLSDELSHQKSNDYKDFAGMRFLSLIATSCYLLAAICLSCL